MFKKIKRVNKNIEFVNHWEKRLENGVKVQGCTLKRNKIKKSDLLNDKPLSKLPKLPNMKYLDNLFKRSNDLITKLKKKN